MSLRLQSKRVQLNKNKISFFSDNSECYASVSRELFDRPEKRVQWTVYVARSSIQRPVNELCGYLGPRLSAQITPTPVWYYRVILMTCRYVTSAIDCGYFSTLCKLKITTPRISAHYEYYVEIFIQFTAHGKWKRSVKHLRKMQKKTVVYSFK